MENSRKLTNYYIPNSGDDLRFMKTVPDQDNEERKFPNNQTIFVEVANSNTESSEYILLVEKLELHEMTNSQYLMMILGEDVTSEENRTITTECKAINEVEAKILWDVLWLRKSVEQLSYEYNISLKEINRLKSVYR